MGDERRREETGPSDEVVWRLKLFAESDAERAARERRRRWAAIAAFTVVAITCASGWSVYRWSKRQWARYEALPQGRSLFDQGNNLRAYQLALDAAQYIPNESSLAQLWSDISQSVTVHSEPAGAEVEWRPYADTKAVWQKLGQTPLEKSRIPAGPIRIRVTMLGYEPVEVAVDRVSFLGKPEFIGLRFPSGTTGIGLLKYGAHPARAGSSGALSSSKERRMTPLATSA